MKRITILSGKGGVGKSSITASLAIALSKKYKIVLADCDVDAPNLALVFGKDEKDFLQWQNISTNQKAVFDLDKCISCQKCYDTCYFKAIDWRDDKPHLKEFSCEGCGMAEVVCPVGAIKLEDVKNAKIGYVESDYGFKIVSSQLKIGESGSGKLVTAVKNKAEKMSKDCEIILVDSAAGVGCPVIASVSGSDLCVLVVEPTPSSFCDMKKALEITKHFNIKSGIIINKYNLDEKNYKKIEEFAKSENIPVIEKIPYDKSFVKALVKMTPVVKINEKINKIFNHIASRLDELIKNI
jgi:MinD superfamily P-loop ATPase